MFYPPPLWPVPSSPRVAFLFFKLGVLKSQVAIGNLRLDLAAGSFATVTHFLFSDKKVYNETTIIVSFEDRLVDFDIMCT